MTIWPHTAAILAGGLSTRMGGVRKESLRLADGRAMIEHVRDALAARCARVVVVVGSPPLREGEANALPELARVRDLREGAGPLGGIEALLASGIDSQYLVCPCDMPRISDEVIDALLRDDGAPATVVRIAGEDSSRPLPARIESSLLRIVREQLESGERAVHRFIERIDAQVIEVPASAAAALVNVNSPEDLEGLR